MRVLRSSALALILFGSATLAAHAQTPIGEPQTNLSNVPGRSSLSSVAVDGQGTITLLWRDSRGSRTYGRRFSADDEPLGGTFLLSRSFTTPRAAANERGDTFLTWNERTSQGDQVKVRRLHAGQPQLNVTASRGKLGPLRRSEDVAVDRLGRFVAVWVEAENAGGHLHVQRFNADGTRLGREITLAGDGLQLDPRVAMTSDTGDFALVWRSVRVGKPDRVLMRRFFAASGEFTGMIQVNSTSLPDSFSSLGVGASENGSVVVLWRRNPRLSDNSSMGAVVVQRLSRSNSRLGGETVVAQTPRFGTDASLDVTPGGGFGVAWQAANGPAFRLFHADGTPAGPVVDLDAPGQPTSPIIAFGWDDTLAVGWTDTEPADWQIGYQRFTVPAL